MRVALYGPVNLAKVLGLLPHDRTAPHETPALIQIANDRVVLPRAASTALAEVLR